MSLSWAQRVIHRLSSAGSTTRSVFPPQSFVPWMPGSQTISSLNWQEPARISSSIRLKTRAGIVTCGVLCPGLNDVIRSLFFEMHHAFSVEKVVGFRWDIKGGFGTRRRTSGSLTHELVDRIHR